MAYVGKFQLFLPKMLLHIAHLLDACSSTCKSAVVAAKESIAISTHSQKFFIFLLFSFLS